MMKGRMDYSFIGQEHCHILSTFFLRFDYHGYENVDEIESNLWIFSFDLRTLEFVIAKVE